MANIQNPIIVPPAPPAPTHLSGAQQGQGITLNEYNTAVTDVATFRALPANTAHTVLALTKQMRDLEIVTAWEEAIRLTAERNQAQQTHNAFGALIAAATAAAGQPAQPPQPPPNQGAQVAQIKIQQPKEFEGDQEQARDFIQALRLYFTLPQHATLFPTDESKIRFALTRLGGRALQWARPITRAFLTQNPLPQLCTNWDTFVQNFGATFYNPNEAEENRMKWNDLKHTTSVAQYAVDFRDLMGRLDFDNADLERANRNQFLKGLKPRVLARMQEMGLPADLEDVIAMAIRIDTAQFISWQTKTQGLTSSSPRGKTTGSGRLQIPGTAQRTVTQSMSAQQPAYTYRSSPAPGQAPTFSSVKQEPANALKGRISDQERQHRQQNQLCFYCAQPGHRAKDCPHKRGAQVNHLHAPSPPSTTSPNFEPDHSWERFANTPEDAPVFHNQDF